MTHKTVELDLAHAKEGQLYIEDGRWVVHVFPTLSSKDAAAVTHLCAELDGLMGRETGWDTYRVHLTYDADAHRT